MSKNDVHDESVSIESKIRIPLSNGQVKYVVSNESIDLNAIPIIDVSGINSPNISDRMAIAKQIRTAATEIGFFYVINHGIDTTLSTKTFDQAKRFFSLPTEQKMKAWTGLLPGEFFGYHPMEAYNRNGWKQKDLCEAYNWGYSAHHDPQALDTDFEPPSIWPDDLPGFKEALYEYHTALLQFARDLTRMFALALGLDENAFDKYVRHPEASMRVLHYPQQAHSVDDQNGIGAHTDVEAFTIVTQDDCGGLEVLKDEQWIRAHPVPGSFVVNIADCFMRQTNDLFVSTVHRVINKSGRERYSAPFFFGFDRRMLLEPIQTCITDENPAKYPVMTGGEYYSWRTKQTKTVA